METVIGPFDTNKKKIYTHNIYNSDHYLIVIIEKIISFTSVLSEAERLMYSKSSG